MWTALAVSAVLAAAPLTSFSERSGWMKTGRYEEVERLCKAFQARYPTRARCVSFGTTPQGRSMVVLVLSDDGTLTPAQARAKKRPVVLFQGGIHAGEIDGKDAGMWLARDLLEGKAAPGALKQLTAVFVPVFNIDGHERFGPNQRPNQNGPESMGWRVTAQNINLNRDYMKADAPEMVAMLTLLNAWDPLVYMDLHVTDGAQFQPDVALLMNAPEQNPVAQAVVKALEAPVFETLRKQGHTPLDFYPNFLLDDEPLSGFVKGVPTPRFSTGYWALRNRIAVLVETHSWKDYSTRVKTTYDVLDATLTQVAANGADWYAKLHAEDERLREDVLPTLAVTFRSDVLKPTVKRKIEFAGYAFRKETASVSGKPYVVYDVKTPQVWKVPYFSEMLPEVTVTLPRAGYLVPAEEASWVAAKLNAHGIHFTKLSRTQTLPVQTFRALETKWQAESYEGRQQLAVKGSWQPETREVRAGALFVPVAQETQRVIAGLFEPLAPDSFLGWGFFNGAFEQKEYIERYVLEPWAKQLLATHPEVKADFDARLKDAAFAKDPAARTRYFAQRHPSWDERLNLYPVFRTDTVPTAK